MLRVKGSFRNGPKQGARSNLHNFRSSSNPVKYLAPAEVVEAKIEKVILDVKVEEAVKAPAKKRGRPKKEK